MQEAGRGRQRGQQLPGFRAGAWAWPPPGTRSDARPPGGSPTQSLTEGPGALGLPDSRGLGAPPRGRSGNCRALVPHRSSTTAQARFLFPPGCTRAAVLGVHSPHVPTHPPPYTAALTGPQESGGQRWLWQRTVPATQEQTVQGSTAQRSPEATWRPWCSHDCAGAEGTWGVRGKGQPPLLHSGSRSSSPHHPYQRLGIVHSTCQCP